MPIFRGICSPSILTRTLVGVVVLGFLDMASVLSSPRIADISIRISGKAQANILFEMDASGKFPPYFQKVDSVRKSVSLSFLETESAMPMGLQNLPSGSPVAWIEIRRTHSPSGKVFLAIEMGMPHVSKTDWAMKVKGKNTLTFDLGKSTLKGNLKEWSLAKNLHQTTQVETKSPPPTGMVIPTPPVEPVEPMKPAPKPPVEIIEATPKEPVEVAKATPKKPVAAMKPSFAQVKEICVMASAKGEEISVEFQGKSTPKYRMEIAQGGAPALGITFLQTRADSATAKFELGKAGWVRSVRWKQVNDDLGLVFLLDSMPFVQGKDSVRAGRLTVTYPRRAGEIFFTWTTRNPEKLPKLPEDPSRSAHTEGKSWETKSDKNLTRSQIFSVSSSGQSMVLIRDSAAFVRNPEGKAEKIHSLVAGERVKKVGSKFGYFKVVSGMDTGYVKSAFLVYADELTTTQAHALELKIQARLAKAVAPVPLPQEPEAKAIPEAKVLVEKKVALPEKKGRDEKLSMPSGLDEARRGVSPEALRAEKNAIDSEKIDLAPTQERVAYNSYGRRDPFIPVDQGSMDNGIDIDQMKLVGIVWENQEPLAILEHVKDVNLSFTVRQGDPVHNGRIARIMKESVTFDLTEFGISRSFTLKLVPTHERGGK